MPPYKTYIPIQGYTDIINPGELGITQLHFGILNLAPKTTFFDHSDDTEVALIALSGSATLLVGHNGNKANGILGERPDVFDGEACVAFIPYYTTYELITSGTGSEIAVCKTPSDSEAVAAILGPGEILDETDSHLRIREFQTEEVSNKLQHSEAVCLYKFWQEEGSAVVWMESAAAEAKPIVLHHNNVLAVPAGTRFSLPDSEVTWPRRHAIHSRSYTLCIEHTG